MLTETTGNTTGGIDPEATGEPFDLSRASGPDGVRRCKYGAGRFELAADGVRFVGTDNDGAEKEPIWLCSPLEVVARTRDTKSAEWGRLLEWRDSDNITHRWAMPLASLQGDGLEVRKELARQGLTITTGRQGRDLLATYLQVWPTSKNARCVDRLGWTGDGLYVTPSETLGESDELTVFQNEHATEPAFSTAGTPEAWRDSVARLAVGNSRLSFALCVALAAPLAELAGEQSGGFHLRGGSSSGKSTTLDAAASVWGKPSAYVRLWRATTNGLEGLAALHNDGLLILDELSQANPREVGETAYMLANGQGKSRASRTGTARPAAKWRLLVLSSGEESLTAMMAKDGRKANAGQEIRLADIDVDAGKGFGAFEELHELGTSAALAQAIKEASGSHYGAVGMAWLRHVVAERASLLDRLPAMLKNFVTRVSPPESSGQVQRVARRFALAAAAGELATGYGLTGWKAGEANNAAAECFAAWLHGFGGAGNKEGRDIIAKVRAFIGAHGSSRFESITATGGTSTKDRAGFTRHTAAGLLEYLLFHKAFADEACAGYDTKAAAKALRDAGFLIPGGDGKSTQKTRIPELGVPRLYVISSRILEGDD